MPPQPTTYFWRRHPLVTAALALSAYWLVQDGWYTTVAVLAGLTALVALRRYRRARKIRHAGLRARADLEHRMALAGDPRGTHGRYPPQQAGWFPDPARTAAIRYFDGVTWTGCTARPIGAAQLT